MVMEKQGAPSMGATLAADAPVTDWSGVDPVMLARAEVESEPNNTELSSEKPTRPLISDKNEASCWLFAGVPNNLDGCAGLRSSPPVGGTARSEAATGTMIVVHGFLTASVIDLSKAINSRSKFSIRVL